jgi:hypothetical protein
VLAEPGLLNDKGIPPQYGQLNQRLADAGLHVIGFTSPLTGHLREIGLLAKRVARMIAKQPSVVAR